MKILLFLILFNLNNVFASQYELIVNDHDKILNIYSFPTLSFDVSKLDVGDDSFYANLVFETVSTLLSDEEVESLKSKYQGYTINYLSSSMKDTTAELTVGAYKKTINLFNSPNAVKVSDSLFLTKEEYLATQQNDNVELEYNIYIHPQVYGLLEERSLPANTCNDLFSHGDSMLDVAGKLEEVNNSLKLMRFQYSETKKSLLKNLEKTCIKNFIKNPKSILELIHSRVTPNSNFNKIEGKTFGKSFAKMPLNLKISK